MKVELININKSYGDHKILNNINLTIDSGDFIGIFGKSGTGKTTLLNIIGQIESYDGKILFNDNELLSKKDRLDFLRNTVGFIYQNYGLIENETVLQNLEIVMSLNKLNRNERLRKINSVLSKLGIKGYEERKVFTLSGGEQQRVAIAKLLLKDVKLILADEPTASLDQENSDAIYQELINLNKKGVTVILVTHDNDLITRIDKIIEI